MPRVLLMSAAVLAATLAACAPRRADTPPPQAEVTDRSPVATAPISQAPLPRAARTVDEYKMLVAQRIAHASSETFAEPLPEMLKSVVVLDIRIDRNGVPQQVSVRRSNGIRALEQRALESVRRAAPFDAPSWRLLRGGSVDFLETFLFRDDGRFQIRSLVEAPK